MRDPSVPVSARFLLLSGLGADARQFDPQRAVFTDARTPPWIPHRPDESLHDYARRFCETVVIERPFVLVGSSFGGMVAQEIAPLLRPEAVFLIASARHGDQIAAHLQYFSHFASILPERMFEIGQGLTPLYASKFGRLNAEQKALLEAMVADTLPAFVRWGIDAITTWPGVENLSMPVHHIHGGDDELIPVEGVEADVVVPGGGHLLNVTHADVVNAFIVERLAKMG
jgi:pimeloyl-ACP methyl ester carboxylesterase